MSLSRTLQTNKTIEVDGENQEFELLDIYDIAKIDEARKSALQSVAKTNGKEAGLTNADLYNIAMDISARDFTLNELLGYVMTPKGSADVLERSLVKSGLKKEDARAIIAKMEAVSIINLAQDLLLAPRKSKEEPANPNEGTSVVSTQQTQPTVSTDGAQSSHSTTSTSTESVKPSKMSDAQISFGE